MEENWYKDWFNSPWYHLLYNKRDETEAEKFIRKLLDFLKLPEGSGVWDMACGKGRHAAVLAKSGYSVTGTDLSENSITDAQKQNISNAEFYVHDMRAPFRVNYYHAVMNLFTSFGYFESERDNVLVFKNAYRALLPAGFFVLDFFNAEMVKKNLCAEATEQRNGITFHIQKEIKGGFIHKKIKFEAEGKMYAFEERVNLLGQEDFKKYAAATGFKLHTVAGNYDLQKFDLDHSDRLILVFTK